MTASTPSPLLPDATAWLYLAAVQDINPADWLTLLRHYNISAARLVSQWQQRALPEELQGHPWINKLAQQQARVESALQWLNASPNHHLVVYDSVDYPAMLEALTSPPLVLFVRGNPALLQRPCIAIVGSRRATHSALQKAHYFASQLAQCGITVVSGMASGIDGAAHKGTLAVNQPTIAVVGSGPDVVYPRRHRQLADDIAKSGAIVSEFWPGTQPRAFHFPRRNRIIAALSMGTLVVEAAIKSGTLITANLAIDLGREVFAIPGNIDNPMTQGCHLLIQQGAKLVKDVEDIIDELSSYFESALVVPSPSEQKSQDQCLATSKILDSVDYDITAVDVIAERNNLPVQAVMAALLEYELRGWVAAIPGGYIKLRGK